MRICLVFDCLYPHTVGGAERWYRNLAEDVARRGHTVTYLTLLQWDPDTGPGVANVDVLAVARAGRALRARTAEHRRAAAVRLRRLPPSRAPRRPVRRRADAGAPRLAARGARGAAVSPLLARRRLVRGLDARVLARLPGRSRGPARLVGPAVLGADEAPTRSASRGGMPDGSRRSGYRGRSRCSRGSCDRGVEASEPLPAESTVVFAGRLIPEKQATAIVPAVALARERVPELRATIFGDGPEREALLRLIDESGLDGAVQAPGFVAGELVEDAVRRALVPRLPVAARGVRARGRRSCGGRDADGRRRRARQRGRRAGRGRRERRSSRSRPSRRSSGRRFSACTRRGPRCGSRPRTGSAATASGSRSRPRSSGCSPSTAGASACASASTSLHLVPRETGGGELYVRRLVPALLEARARPRAGRVRRPRGVAVARGRAVGARRRARARARPLSQPAEAGARRADAAPTRRPPGSCRSAPQRPEHGARDAARPPGDDDPRRDLQAPSGDPRRACWRRVWRCSSRWPRGARGGSSRCPRRRRRTSPTTCTSSATGST